MLATTETTSPRRRGRKAGVFLDRRTAAWRERKELIASYVASLGSEDALTVGEMTRIERAAELQVIARRARERHIAGEGVTIDEVVRAEGAAGRAERELNLPRPGARPPGPTLAEMMRADTDDEADDGAAS